MTNQGELKWPIGGFLPVDNVVPRFYVAALKIKGFPTRCSEIHFVQVLQNLKTENVKMEKCSDGRGFVIPVKHTVCMWHDREVYIYN